MKKSKNILLFLFFLHHMYAEKKSGEGLRYSELETLSGLPASTIRGAVTSFVRSGFVHQLDDGRERAFVLTKNGTTLVEDLFPSLMHYLRINRDPSVLAISTANPTGTKRRAIESLGGIQFRSGVWVFLNPSRESYKSIVRGLGNPLILRIDALQEEELFTHFQSTALFRKDVRARTDIRNLLQRAKKPSALISRFVSWAQSKPLLPENIYRKELRLISLLPRLSVAVFKQK